MREIGWRARVFEAGVVDVLERFESQLIQSGRIAQPLREDIIDLEREPVLQPPARLDLQRIVMRVAEVIEIDRTERVWIREEVQRTVQAVHGVLVGEFAGLSVFDQRADGRTAQLASAGKLGEDGKLLASGDRGVVGRIERAIRFQRKESIVLRFQKVAEKSVGDDIGLIQVESAEQLRRMIANEARFNDRALKLLLDRKRELLVVGRLELGIDEG